MSESPGGFEFDVALSFAGEDRAYVDAVAAMLTARQVRPFYDQDAAADTWGRDLYVYLDEVYRKKARFAVVFVSRHYVAKPWTAHERQSAQARALVEVEPYMLPVRLDDSELPGLRPTVAYVDARQVSKERLVDLIMHKLGRLPSDGPHQRRPIGVPRTVDEENRLLTERPPLWEYLLFAGVMVQGKSALEPNWRDHQLGYVRPAGPRLNDQDAANFIGDAMDQGRAYAGNLNRALDPQLQELAFGAPGEPGDADRIKHHAQRVVGMYEDFLDWAARMRATRVSEQFQPVFDIAATFLDQPLREVRAFIDRCAEEIDRLPALLADPSPEPIRIEMTLELTIDQRTVEALDREIDRVTRNRR